MVEPDVLPTVLPRLTALRTFAALSVLLYHLEAYNVFLAQRAPFTYGYSGVAFFFILSGFVLTWSAKSNLRAREFYFRRFARIYPLYLVVLVMAFIIPYSPAPPHRGLVPSLLSISLLQAWIPRFTYSVNPPAWSLSCEVFFYAVMPLLLKLFHKLSRRSYFLLGAAWVISTGVFGALLATHLASWTNVVYPIGNPVVRSGEFVLGILCALALRDGLRLPLSIAFLVTGGAIASIVFFPFPSPIPQIELELVFAVILLRYAQADISSRRGALRARGLVYAGNVSYAFYLIHPVALVTVQHFLGNGIGPAAAIFLLCGAVAVLLHETVERPAQRALLNRQRRRAQRTPMIWKLRDFPLNTVSQATPADSKNSTSQ